MEYGTICLTRRDYAEKSGHEGHGKNSPEGEFMELYIHIPFCARKCRYCSFVSFPEDENRKEEYIEALLEENRIRGKEYTEQVSTVYVGGGTPSLLSPDQFRRLVLGIRQMGSWTADTEFTVEANPGTLTDEFLETAAELGVNRVSLGMQSAEDHILQFLGRIHTFREVEQSVASVRRHGITNLNLDLIFGIPGQSAAEWEHTLDAALSLEPEHISAYGLIPEEGTPIYEEIMSKETELPDAEAEREMYDTAIRKLSLHGLEQYEISNFARKGYECRHNIGYWTQIPYVGLGISAASMSITQRSTEGITFLRRTNPSEYGQYIRSVRELDDSQILIEKVDKSNARFETMMLGLRMKCGVSEETFRNMHGVTMDSCYGDRLRAMESCGMMKLENRRWSLTRKGMDIQNSILLEFMDD